MSGPDYIVDIASLKGSQEPSVDDRSLRGRPWLAVKWRCCSVYSRVYRNAEGTAYVGNCPKCRKRVQARVGEGGTNNRFFEAG